MDSNCERVRRSRLALGRQTRTTQTQGARTWNAWGPADKGVLPFNPQLATTAEFSGLLPGRSRDSISQRTKIMHAGFRHYMNGFMAELAASAAVAPAGASAETIKE